MYCTLRLFRGPLGRPRPLVVQAAVYSGSQMAHAAPSLLLSLEAFEAEVMGNTWVTLHNLVVTEKSQLVVTGIELGTTGSRVMHARCLATTSPLPCNLGKQIEAFSNKYLRRIMGYCWFDCVPNWQLLHETESRPTACTVHQCQLRH